MEATESSAAANEISADTGVTAVLSERHSQRYFHLALARVQSGREVHQDSVSGSNMLII